MGHNSIDVELGDGYFKPSAQRFSRGQDPCTGSLDPRADKLNPSATWLTGSTQNVAQIGGPMNHEMCQSVAGTDTQTWLVRPPQAGTAAPLSVKHSDLARLELPSRNNNATRCAIAGR